MRIGLRLWATLAVIVLCVTSLPASVAAGNSQYFPETNQTSANAFYDFWLAHGKAEILGLPLSPSYRDQDHFIVQVYERAVMEWHPDNTRENRVQLTRLGDFALNQIVDKDKQRIGDRYRAEAPRPCSGSANCETFSATKHTLLGAFRDYWYARGGLAVFGYPLTEEFRLRTFDGGGTSFVVQYFERNRFEFHPEINGGTVLLGRLGAPIWDYEKDDLTDAPDAVVPVPDYDGTTPPSTPPSPTVTNPPPVTTTTPPAVTTPVAVPSPVPTAQPPTGATGSVTFTAVQGAAPGGQVSVTVQTAPNAACSINYFTPSGLSTTAQGLVNQNASASGAASWTWMIDAATRSGIGTVIVTCNGIANSTGITIG